MSIYMQVPSIRGHVSATNYQNWIELDTLSFGAKRLVLTQVGNNYDRIRSLISATKWL